MRMKLIYAVLAAVPVTLLAFSSGPPIRRTGIVDGGANCSVCHSDRGRANSDPLGSVKLEDAQPYQPGVAQTIKVTISHPDQSRWGFQLTARFINDGSMAGSFAPVDGETKVICDDGARGVPGPCASASTLSWIEHVSAVRSATGAGHSYQLQWTPPAQENGDIMFYYAGNAANGDGNLTGDHIYTSTTRVSLSDGAGCPQSRVPVIRSTANAGPHAGSIAPNGMVEIYGSDFQAGSTNRIAGAGDFVSGAFPKALGCIAVEIAGQRVPITYVQKDQINVQAPTVTATGPVSVLVIANPGKSNEIRSVPSTVTLQAAAPAFFQFGASTSIAARFAGKAAIVADPAIVPGGAPAKPGDIVSLFGTGFGTTNPPVQAGDITPGLAPLAGSFTVQIGGTTLAAADITYAGLSPQSISGLYQFDVRIPSSAADGNLPVVVTTGGVSSPATATIPVKK